MLLVMFLFVGYSLFKLSQCSHAIDFCQVTQLHLPVSGPNPFSYASTARSTA